MLKIAWAPCYKHALLPPDHRFPMIKYELLPEQLLYEGTIGTDNLFEPQPVAIHHILRVHEAGYWQDLSEGTLAKAAIRKIGFPLSPELVHRECTIMQGTLQCADYALQYGIAMNIAGGTHHAYADRGEGFCLLNDIAIAAQYLLDEGKAKQVLVIDLDVHQGNGTASIFQDNPSVYTFSMHGAHNYPLHKESSDWDIPLPDGIGDEAYLALVAKALPQLYEKVQPDFVFYQSGVDVLASDKLGRLGLSLAGCKNRDEQVLRWCSEHKLPVVASMGGGYSPKISDIVEAHANTFRLAQAIFF